MPEPIGRELAGYQVAHTHRLGWGRLTNGGLMAHAEQVGFDVLLTVDQSTK